jgi:GDP-4-dehydro-6-deoxy-D-mannose reductase
MPIWNATVRIQKSSISSRGFSPLPCALITGITGFVGPWLALHLRSLGFECAGIGRGTAWPHHPISLADVRMHSIDIRDRAAVHQVIADESPDWIFHLAAISHVPAASRDPELTFDVNVGGTFNVLESVRQLGRRARVVFVSTGHLYGNIDSGESGFSEESPVQDTSFYGTTKLMGEQLVRSLVRDCGLEIVIARPFNHTGPGQPPSFACPEFARAIAEGVNGGGPVHLRTGRLEPLRDISDVRDVVRAYTLLAERGTPGEAYNVCSGTMVSMAEVIRNLAELGRVEVTTELDPAKVRAREIMRSGGNCAKIRRGLAWKPEIPLTTTLRDLLDDWVQREPAVRDAATSS